MPAKEEIIKKKGKSQEDDPTSESDSEGEDEKKKMKSKKNKKPSKKVDEEKKKSKKVVKKSAEDIESSEDEDESSKKKKKSTKKTKSSEDKKDKKKTAEESSDEEKKAKDLKKKDKKRKREDGTIEKTEENPSKKPKTEPKEAEKPKISPFFPNAPNLRIEIGPNRSYCEPPLYVYANSDFSDLTNLLFLLLTNNNQKEFEEFEEWSKKNTFSLLPIYFLMKNKEKSASSFFQKPAKRMLLGFDCEFTGEKASTIQIANEQFTLILQLKPMLFNMEKTNSLKSFAGVMNLFFFLFSGDKSLFKKTKSSYSDEKSVENERDFYFPEAIFSGNGSLEDLIQAAKFFTNQLSSSFIANCWKQVSFPKIHQTFDESFQKLRDYLATPTRKMLGNIFELIDYSGNQLNDALHNFGDVADTPKLAVSHMEWGTWDQSPLPSSAVKYACQDAFIGFNYLKFEFLKAHDANAKKLLKAGARPMKVLLTVSISESLEAFCGWCEEERKKAAANPSAFDTESRVQRSIQIQAQQKSLHKLNSVGKHDTTINDLIGQLKQKKAKEEN